MVAKPVTEAVDVWNCWRFTGADWDLFRDFCCSELTAVEVSKNALNQFTSTLINITEK
jgi:hypothetical protein